MLGGSDVKKTTFVVKGRKVRGSEKGWGPSIWKEMDVADGDL
jgi:hypothetical protein